MTTPTEAVAQSTLGGGVALFIILTGIEPQALVWGVFGSIIGVMFAKETGRLYGIALFLAASFSSALAGTAMAEFWAGGSVVARNVFVVACGAGFHPALAAAIKAIPGIVDAGSAWLIRRFGGGQ